jgi:hypothetical protein
MEIGESMQSFASPPVPLGRTIHIKRPDGTVDRYVYDGRYRNLTTGQLHHPLESMGQMVGTPLVIEPEDDPNREAREEARARYFHQVNVAEADAPEGLLQEADQFAEREFPYPHPRFE